MLIKIKVDGSYFKVSICENIIGTQIYKATIKYKNIMWFDVRNDIKDYVKNRYTIKFDRIRIYHYHIFTIFKCTKKPDRTCEYTDQYVSLLINIKDINKALSNKNIAELIDIYEEHMNKHDVSFKEALLFSP